MAESLFIPKQWLLGTNLTFPVNVEPGTLSIRRQSSHAGVMKTSLVAEQCVPFRFREVGLQPEHGMNAVRNQLDQPRFNLLRNQIHEPADVSSHHSWPGVNRLS